ncbi:MAG TPA: Sec-independent protein translocase subunit TatA [Jatrophihabitans sp.]|nr:Sec-independent protein translocase subunit TatA [Jatrophihabitans sp.]
MFDSPWHWAVVAVVAFVLFFGWKQLPDMSRSLGRSLRIFKTEIKGMGEDDKARTTRDSESGEPPAVEAASGEQAAPKALPQPAPAREAAVVRPRPTPGGSAPAGPQSRATSGQ